MEMNTNTIRLMLDITPGIFYTVPGGYFLSKKKVKAFTTVQVGELLPASSMFNIKWIQLNGESIGWLLSSQFHVDNGGGYLITFMQSKGKAIVSDVIKDPHLVIYNFPNRGSIAVSPLVGPDVLNIFEEQ